MLFQEGRYIQKHLTVAPNDNQAAHTFNYLMLQRKVSATLCVISNDTKGGVLSLDEPTYTHRIWTPGVRPIDIDEVPQGIMAKAILKTLCDDIHSAARPFRHVLDLLQAVRQ